MDPLISLFLGFLEDRVINELKVLYHGHVALSLVTRLLFSIANQHLTVLRGGVEQVDGQDRDRVNL